MLWQSFGGADNSACGYRGTPIQQHCLSHHLVASDISHWQSSCLRMQEQVSDARQKVLAKLPALYNEQYRLATGVMAAVLPEPDQAADTSGSGALASTAVKIALAQRFGLARNQIRISGTMAAMQELNVNVLRERSFLRQLFTFLLREVCPAALVL